MSCSREELRALLRPWTQAQHVLPNVSQRGDVVWIRMSHEDRDGFLPVVYEAIELLTLVGELDVAAWREAVQLIWKHGPLKQTHPDKALQFGLDLSSCSTDDVTVASYSDRVLSTGVTSTEYSDARTKLETLYKQKEDAGEDITPRVELQIPVRVTRDHLERQGAEVSMRELWQVVDKQDANRQRNATTHAWPLLTRIVRVSIGEHGQFMNAEAFEYATKIVARGVAMETLSLSRVPFVEEKSVQYIQGLQLLMGARGCEDINIGVKTVTIPAKISERMSSAAYSALFKSESVVDVSVSRQKKQHEDYFDDSHNLTWQWTALSLFTTHATQVFDDVRISVDNFDDGNINAMDTVFDDPNPLRVIAESMYPGIQLDSVETKEATVSKFRLSLPRAHDQAVIDLGEQTVDVIGRHRQQTTSTERWYCVLLPGWGPAWVKEEDCTLSGTRVDGARVRAPSRLWLSSINARCMLPVAALLRRVGKDIKHLKLSSITFHEPMDEWWLESILQACPHLESLVIEDGGNLMSLNSIAKYYEAGHARVPSIHLCGVHLKDTADASRFFRNLANPSHAMARRLGHLTLQLGRMRLPFTGAVDAIHEMLENNTNLQYLRLVVSYQTKLLQRDMPKAKDFLRHQGKVVVGSPLAIRQKLAVLSLVTESTPQNFPGANALRDLDSKVLSKIFEFAAKPTNRFLVMHFDHVGRQPKPFPEY